MYFQKSISDALILFKSLANTFWMNFFYFLFFLPLYILYKIGEHTSLLTQQENAHNYCLNKLWESNFSKLASLAESPKSWKIVKLQTASFLLRSFPNKQSYYNSMRSRRSFSSVVHAQQVLLAVQSSNINRKLLPIDAFKYKRMIKDNIYGHTTSSEQLKRFSA